MKWWEVVRAGCYKLSDRKTGDTYPVYIHERRLYSVLNLPFELNHWEKVAISEAFPARYAVVRERRLRIINARQQRERQAREAAELKARAEFAKRFQ